jgi:glutamate-ammonia-ligase adenylyltransferase
MTTHLASQITRVPRIFDAGRAGDAAALCDGMAPEVKNLIAGAASASPYLMGLLEKEHLWLAGAIEDPDAALAKLRDDLPAEEGIADALRQAKRRMALLVALADLGGALPLTKVTGALSDFADAVCGAALRAALAPLLRRGKLPGMSEADLPDAGGMVVLAMGKMGAHELNYSSDIDLICLFDETRFDPDSFHAARTTFVKATRQMCATLSDLTGGGYVFRTDLRLRPDPAVTPVCISMEAAERYYEALGRTWERAAYIKARVAAGDRAAGQQFLKTLTPFVWRRHLDFAAIQDAHDMRLAIRDHKGLGGPITLPGHNMKQGRGGIREIEFFTQTRQLIAGGRDPDLRLRGTCEGLRALAQKGWITGEVARTLADHYKMHRTVEHRLQMIRDAQTHALPQSDEEFARLAALMDMEVADLKADIHRRLEEVHALTDGFFAGPAVPAVETRLQGFDEKLIASWRSYPALRSPRAVELFERLKPDLLRRLGQAARPEEALLAFDGFLSGLPAGVQFFSLIHANPSLADLLIDIITISPALAGYLSRNAGVLDAVIGGDFFSDWPGETGLTDQLARLLEAEPDYETRLDSTRRWAREWHFRVGVHLLRGLSDPATAGAQYADLARAVLGALWPVVIDQFSQRHGPPPGRGAVILGMGSLGAGRLTATSDLDILVIYDAAGQEMSDGPRALSTRQYYARLTQAMITAMTAPMAQGRLYEIDMRLRPSGNQGPVATSLNSFDHYQRNEAWVWEHLALTRASVVAGPADLGREVAGLITDVLDTPSDPDHIAAEVSEMRARIAEAKAPDGSLDAKIGPGRLQDIELCVQAEALVAGEPAHDIPAALRATSGKGWLSMEATAVLKAAYRDCWSLQCASRLLSATPPAPDALGQTGAVFLCRAVGQRDLVQLEAHMRALYAEAAARIDAAIHPDQGEADEGQP